MTTKILPYDIYTLILSLVETKRNYWSLRLIERRARNYFTIDRYIQQYNPPKNKRKLYHLLSRIAHYKTGSIVKIECRNSYFRMIVHTLANVRHIPHHTIIDNKRLYRNIDIRDSNCCDENHIVYLSFTPKSYIVLGKAGDKIIIPGTIPKRIGTGCSSCDISYLVKQLDKTNRF
jgi:hypothetical protein